jgi:hypothetical protein
MTELLTPITDQRTGSIDTPEAPRFSGTPADVPILPAEVFVDKAAWRPGALCSNNGLLAAHDRDMSSLVRVLRQGDRSYFENQEYQPQDAVVPFTGADHRGYPREVYAREYALMEVNAAARQNGVKGRTLTSVENGRQYDRFTPNPFDEGDFLDMTAVQEQIMGEVINHPSVVTLMATGTLEQKPEDIIGKFCSNGGILAWVTPEGHTQIAPNTEERVQRLIALGYSNGSIFVPHSNAEKFVRPKDRQAWGEIKLDDMARTRQTMTLEQSQHDGDLRDVVIPAKHIGKVILTT